MRFPVEGGEPVRDHPAWADAQLIGWLKDGSLLAFDRHSLPTQVRRFDPGRGGLARHHPRPGRCDRRPRLHQGSGHARWSHLRLPLPPDEAPRSTCSTSVPTGPSRPALSGHRAPSHPGRSPGTTGSSKRARRVVRAELHQPLDRTRARRPGSSGGRSLALARSQALEQEAQRAREADHLVGGQRARSWLGCRSRICRSAGGGGPRGRGDTCPTSRSPAPPARCRAPANRGRPRSSARPGSVGAGHSRSCSAAFGRLLGGARVADPTHRDPSPPPGAGPGSTAR